MHPDESIELVTAARQRADAYAIRRTVFQLEQGVPAEEEFDADDERALHLLATRNRRAVGTARLVIDGQRARIGRMAVLADSRRHGIGAALLERLIALARQRGVTHLMLHAQVHAVPFYARAGFVVSGDEFIEAGIPHREMERPL